MAKHSRGHRDEDAPFTLDTGETPGTRALRLEHLLFEELYRLFRMEVNDPHLAELVPTSVQMSPDLRNAKVMYALREVPAKKPKPGQPQPVTRGNNDPRLRLVQQALLRVTPFLRTRLADGVSMKRLPDLHFTRDRLAEATLRAQDMMTRERLVAAKQALASGVGAAGGDAAAGDADDTDAAAGDADDTDADDADADAATDPVDAGATDPDERSAQSSHPAESPRLSP